MADRTYGIAAYWSTHTPPERLLRPGEAAAIHARNEAEYRKAADAYRRRVERERRKQAK